jgi:hypothetical protein
LDSVQLKHRMDKVFDGILLVPGTPKENWVGWFSSIFWNLITVIYKQGTVNK